MNFIKKNLYVTFCCLLLAISSWTNLHAIPADTPKIGIDSSGDVVAVWEAFSTGDVYIIQAANFSSSSGTWSTPVNLTTNDFSSTLPSISVNAAGNAVAVWIANNQTTGINTIQAAIYTPGSGWSATQVLSTTDGSEWPFGDYQVRLGNDTNGTVVVTWTAYLSYDLVIRSAKATISTGTWSTAVTISS